MRAHRARLTLNEVSLQIPMDPLEFMLAPHSMTDANYNSWGNGIPYVERLLKGLDYEEFNITRLMPSLTA